MKLWWCRVLKKELMRSIRNKNEVNDITLDGKTGVNQIKVLLNKVIRLVHDISDKVHIPQPKVSVKNSLEHFQCYLYWNHHQTNDSRSSCSHH